MTKHALVASVFALTALAAPASAGFGGLYVGGHAGGIWGDIDTTSVTNTTLFWPLVVPGASTSASVSGVLGGAQLGYDLRFTDWLVGLEIAGSYTSLDQTSFLLPDDVYSVETDWLASASLRFGWIWNARTLVYLKGGFAAASVQTTEADTVGPNTGTFATDEMHNGWLGGVGIEHMLSDDVSFGVEYNYVDLGNQDHSPSAAIVNNVDVQLHSVTARLNWHFWTP